MPEPTSRNTLDFLAAVLDLLAAADVRALVFGGWAEELTGLAAPRPHGDVDLLFPAPSLAAVDRFVRVEGNGHEIRGKRFAHKRAFKINDVAVEVTLVESDGKGPLTRFWGDVLFRWQSPLGESVPTAARPLPVASRANLIRYRALHQTTEPWRWRDPACLVD